MKKNVTKNLTPSTVKLSSHLIALTYVAACMLGLLLSSGVFAQTFPPPSSCTSKDLELISATLPPPANDPCQCSGTRTLVLGIRNKTGSTRTSFALWGTLKRYDASGNLTSSTAIFACAGPIVKNSDNFLPATSGNTSITINCGETLEIVDLYLAWTSANNNETCPTLENSPSTINPKCGTLPKIAIGTGVNATFVVTNATCTGNGSIQVSPTGGVAPYKVKIGNDERTGIAAGGSTTFNLAGGTHSILITDSRPCSITLSRTIGSSSPPDVSGIGGAFTKTCTSNTSGGAIGETAEAGCTYSWTSSPAGFTSSDANPTVNPNATTTYTVRKTRTSTGCFADANVTVTVNNTAPTFSVCLVQPSLCGNTGSVTFTASGGSGFEYSINNGTSYQSSNTFSNLGSGSVTGFKVRNSLGCVSDAACNTTSQCEAITQSSRHDAVSEQSIELQSKQSRRVKPAPNPFSDRIRFSLKSDVSGQGSLELYNMMGQKVQTVFQGRITAGHIQTIEYAVPRQQRTNLVYIFRVGSETTSGKLIGTK